MLVLEQVQYRYQNGRTALSDISFQMKRGDCACLLGPNGAGKTTLLKCLLNFYRPSQGHISLDGKEICRMPAKERAGHLAYVSQSTNMAFPYTVREVVEMGRVNHMRLGGFLSKKDRQAAQEAMEHLGIASLAERNFQTLSGGERQMVLFARALAQQADYLVLDEPTAALDYSNQIRVLETIRRLAGENYGILMTSHSPDHAFLACTKAVLMGNGSVLAFGTPDEVVTAHNLSELYHVPVHVAEVVLEYKKETWVQKICTPILPKGGE